MKKHIILGLSAATILMLSACSDSSDATVLPTTITDIALAANESVTCSTATSFSAIPQGNPKVEFTTDAQNGDVTIKVISGSTTIKNCTKI